MAVPGLNGKRKRLPSEATASSKAFQQRIFYFVAQTPPKYFPLKTVIGSSIAVPGPSRGEGEVAVSGDHGLQQGLPAEDLLFCHPNTTQVIPFKDHHWR
jgi:hypothetical protein